MLILLFTILCVAGVAFLFSQLKVSDRTTADRLRTSLAEEANAGPGKSEAWLTANQ